MKAKTTHVLLIDDDPSFLFLLGETLTKQGYTAHTASNGKRALDELYAHRVDLIISDVLMQDTPIMSLTCTLKNLFPKTPLILMSGLPGGPLIQNALILGADDFVPKPINLNLLCETMNKFRGAFNA
jgi:DNA-binding NtrC family response regulator